MITSNINELLFRTKLNQKEDSNNKRLFLDSLINQKVNENKIRTDDFSFENIKGISLEEIDSLFKTEEDKEKAKNLRLTTLFSDDKYLSNALFNTVLGQPFDIGYSYLYDMYEDKNTFFNSKPDTLADLLHESMNSRIYDSDKKITDKIPQERINEILTAVNSFSFVDALSQGYNNQYDKYKEDNQYSFLYNDYSLKYQELKYKYDELKSVDEKIINQYK